jgi:hypothetical protein
VVAAPQEPLVDYYYAQYDDDEEDEYDNNEEEEGTGGGGEVVVPPPPPHPEPQQQPSSTTTTTATAGAGGHRQPLTPAQLVLLEASRVRRHETSLKAIAALERIAQSDREGEASFREMVLYGAPASMLVLPADDVGSSAAAVDAAVLLEVVSNEQ